MPKTPKQNPRSSSPSVDTIAAECLAVRLRMLNRVVSKIYDDALRPLGLKVSQMNILVATAKLGTARPAEICRLLHLEVSTLSRNVERLKARGWVETVTDPDGRAQPFRVTKAGHKLIEKAAPSWAQAQQVAKQALGPGLTRSLSKTTPGPRS